MWDACRVRLYSCNGTRSAVIAASLSLSLSHLLSHRVPFRGGDWLHSPTQRLQSPGSGGGVGGEGIEEVILQFGFGCVIRGYISAPRRKLAGEERVVFLFARGHFLPLGGQLMCGVSQPAPVPSYYILSRLLRTIGLSNTKKKNGKPSPPPKNLKNPEPPTKNQKTKALY